MIAAAAVVSAANAPLFVRAYAAEEDALRFHSIVHCALDVTDERLAAPRAAPGAGDAYLGLLCPADEFLVYGFATCTRVKLLLVLDGADVSEDAVRDAFRRMHAAFIDAVSNPWQPPGKPLRSAAFGRAVDALAAASRGWAAQGGAPGGGAAA
jgi:hypothetical protein